MSKNPIVNITENAVSRAKCLLQSDSTFIGLRISVSQGGCSGMTYNVELSEKITSIDPNVLIKSISLTEISFSLFIPYIYINLLFFTKYIWKKLYQKFIH